MLIEFCGKTIMTPLKQMMYYRLILYISFIMNGLLCAQGLTDETKSFLDKLEPYASTATEIVFVVDSSSSIGSTNFKCEIDFVKDLSTQLSISTTHVLPALVTYAYTSKVVRNIDYISNSDGKNKCTFVEEVNSSPYIGVSGTYTFYGLREALEILKTSRQDAKRLIILLTNGRGGVCPRRFRAVLDELKRENIDTFAVTLGYLNRPRLEEIATKENIFSLNQISGDIANLARDTTDDSSTLQLLPGSDACDCDSKSTCACGTRRGVYMCACDPGYKVGTSRCCACPVNTYSEVYNAVQCTACPDNSETSNIASTSIDQCKCIAGYQMSGGECVPVSCGTPPEGTYATLTPSCSAPYLPGETCTYSCTPGYLTSDGSSTVDITCDDGTWSASSVICIADCGTPPTGTQASKTCSQSPYVNGDFCTYTCNTGYHTSDGSSTVDITCNDGTWSASSVICVADCGTPPTGTQASKTCSQSPYVNGDFCTYTCNTGYHTSDGSSTVDITCNAGIWSDDSVICIADCSAPMLTQATGSCPSPYLHDKTCTYTCNTGYHTSDGSSTVDITCNDGTWSSSSVICIADCGTPPTGTQASEICSQSPYVNGDSCTYTCNTDHHTSDGLSTVDITCNDGTWSASSVICVADCSTPMLTQATGSCASPYLHDVTCTYTCNTGYHTSDGLSTIVITCNDGTWSASSTIICIDDEPPIIDCPSDYSTTSNIIPVQVTWEEPVYNDIVDGINVNVTQTHTSGSSFYIGTTTVEYNVEDQSGNSASCSFTITIVEYMCSPKTIPENGAVACTTWDVGIGCEFTNLSGSQICVLLCNIEYDFESQPASLYICQYKEKKGQWVWALEPCHEDQIFPDNFDYQKSPNCTEPFDINDVKGQIDFQYFVNACTTDSGSQEIRDILFDFLIDITNTIKGATHCSDETICNAEDVVYNCGATTAKRSLDTVLRFTISLEVKRLHNQIYYGEPDLVDVLDEVVTFYITEVDAFIRGIDGITILGAETPEVDIDVDCRRRSTLENDKCLVCGQGSYYDNTTGVCQECAKGYFQHEEASTHCRQCPIGTTTDSSGSNSISHCKAVSNECPMPHHPVDGIFTCTLPPNPPVCHVECQEGFDFAREPADRYICDYSSGWKTEPVGMDELLPNCGESSLVEVARKKIKVDFYHTDCDNNNIKRVQSKFKKTFKKSFLNKQCLPSTICDIKRVSAECTALTNTKTINGVEYNGKIDIKFYIYGNIKNPSNDENVHAAEIAATMTVLDDRAADFENKVNLGDFDVAVGRGTLLIVKSNSYFARPTEEFCVHGSFLKGNTCVTCPVGTFESGTYCEPCPVGTYQDEDGQIECKDCPDGKTTSGRQTASLGECITDN
ncbi:sushi, von Willebrand factor type A, EGF and pentraxin domain-containing protein 1-like [Glandiceps talaboti]